MLKKLHYTIMALPTTVDARFKKEKINCKSDDYLLNHIITKDISHQSKGMWHDFLINQVFFFCSSCFKLLLNKSTPVLIRTANDNKIIKFNFSGRQHKMANSKNYT